MSTVYFDPRARNSRDIHEVKRVSFLGHLRPVILQNENGPCPLIALANAMLLLGWLHLDKKFAYVKNSWIVEQVGMRIERTNREADIEPALWTNMQALIRDVKAALPRLVDGMDLNVCFSGCEAVEFTPEMSVFDLSQLRLVHGFVIDPVAEAALHSFARDWSYNKATMFIVDAEEKWALAESAAAAAACAAPSTPAAPAVTVAAAAPSEAGDAPGSSRLSGRLPSGTPLLRSHSASGSSAFSPASMELLSRARSGASTGAGAGTPGGPGAATAGGDASAEGKEGGSSGSGAAAGGAGLAGVTRTSSSFLLLRGPSAATVVEAGTGDHDHAAAAAAPRESSAGDDGDAIAGVADAASAVAAGESSHAATAADAADAAIAEPVLGSGAAAAPAAHTAAGGAGAGAAAPSAAADSASSGSAGVGAAAAAAAAAAEPLASRAVSGSDGSSGSISGGIPTIAEAAELLDRSSLMRAFLESHPTQCTREGLRQIAAKLTDKEIAILYRNNHFSTIFKYKGALYQLLTDEGFRDEAVSWERLDDIHGGTQLMRDDFTPLDMHVPPHHTAAGGPAASRGGSGGGGGGGGAGSGPGSSGAPGGGSRGPAPSAGLELPPDFDSLPPSEREMLLEVLRASHAEAQTQSGPGGSSSGAGGAAAPAARAGGSAAAAFPPPVHVSPSTSGSSAGAGGALLPPPGVSPAAAYAYSGFSGSAAPGASLPAGAGSVGVGVPVPVPGLGASSAHASSGPRPAPSGGGAGDGWFADGGADNLPLGVIGTGSGPLDLSRPIGAPGGGDATHSASASLPPPAPGLRPHVTLTGVPSTGGAGYTSSGSGSGASLHGSSGSGASLHGSGSSGGLAPGVGSSGSSGAFSSGSGASASAAPRPQAGGTGTGTGSSNDRYGAQAARGAALHQARLERERAQLSGDEALARRLQLEEQGYVFDAAGNVVSRPPGAGGADSGGSTPSGASSERRQAGGGTIKPRGGGSSGERDNCIIM